MRCLIYVALLAAAGASAQTSDAPGPVGGVPATLPELKLPDVRDVQVALPRPVQAAQAAMGLGRQRLALVVGLGALGRQTVLDNAARDVQAVATALRQGGYLVMQREDVSAAGLRAALQEFRTRLQPGGMGFVYVSALGAQVRSQNLLLPRDAALATLANADADAATLATRLQATAVPLAEVVDALQGTADSPRLLVVDAAWRHPLLATLPTAGLAEQRLPPGMMVLFGHGLQAWKDVPATAPLPVPPPADPRALAASRFATVLVHHLLVPRVKGPDALRATRRDIEAETLGRDTPWLSGDTDSQDEFAEATVLDALIPRTPEEFAREGARQLSRLQGRPGAAAAGEQSVEDVLRSGNGAVDAAGTTAAPDARAAVPEKAGGVSATQVLGAAATVASLATTAAAVAATVKVAEAAAAASVASTAVSAATGVAGSAVKLAARAVEGGVGAVASGASVTSVAGSAAMASVGSAATTLAAAPATAAAVAAAPATAAAVAATATSAAGTSAALQRPATDGRTARTADGGERPVYLPRRNGFGHAEGDTYTWQVLDTWKDEFMQRTTTAIEEVLDDGRLLANGGQVALDAQGRTVRLAHPDGSVQQFEPAQDLWWPKPQRGERRKVAFTETFQRADRTRGQTAWTGSSSVGRARTLSLPAGDFEAVPIESSGWWTETLASGTRSSGQWTRTVWVSPQLGQPVAIDIEDTDRLGKRLRLERVELLHAQTQGQLQAPAAGPAR